MRNKRHAHTLLALVLLGHLFLNGCSSNGVKTLGAGVFEITHHGVSLTQSPSELRDEATSEAFAYCLKQGMKTQIIEADKEGGGYGKLPETDVQFRCTKN